MKESVATDEAPNAPGLLSQAIVSNGLIYVSGQIHVTPEGTMVNGSTKEKVGQIMKNVEAILKAAGAGLNDIVKVTVYVTDMAELPKLNEVYPAYFTEPLPARASVCVKALPLGADIEVSVTATKT